MEARQTMKNIRLLLGAADAQESQAEIAAEFVPQIDQARIDIAAMRGADVLAALQVLHKSGLSLAADVRQRVSITSKELSRPPEHRRGRF